MATPEAATMVDNAIRYSLVLTMVNDGSWQRISDLRLRGHGAPGLEISLFDYRAYLVQNFRICITEYTISDTQQVGTQNHTVFQGSGTGR